MLLLLDRIMFFKPPIPDNFSDAGHQCYSLYSFLRYCERYRSKKVLLGDHKDNISYLAERLECERHVLEIHFQRNPGLKRIQITNLKRKLDLLFSEGFTPKDIRYAVYMNQNSSCSWYSSHLCKGCVPLSPFKGGYCT